MDHGRFAIRQVAGEQAVGNDRRALRGNAFIVVAKRAESRPVLEARVGHDVHDVRTVAQLAQFFEREETHAREIRFHAEDAVEFDGMADGFVNLQAELRAVENERLRALGRLRRRMQRDGFFGDARRVAHQVERFDQFVARELMLPAETVRIGALLNFASGKRGGDDARAGLHLDLMDRRTDRRREELLDAAKRHGSFRERHALDARHFLVRGQQQIELAFEWNAERVLDVRDSARCPDTPRPAPSRRRGAWRAPTPWQWPRPRRRRLQFPLASGGRWKQIPTIRAR